MREQRTSTIAERRRTAAGNAEAPCRGSSSWHVAGTDTVCARIQGRATAVEAEHWPLRDVMHDTICQNTAQPRLWCYVG